VWRWAISGESSRGGFDRLAVMRTIGPTPRATPLIRVTRDVQALSSTRTDRRPDCTPASRGDEICAHRRTSSSTPSGGTNEPEHCFAPRRVEGRRSRARRADHDAGRGPGARVPGAQVRKSRSHGRMSRPRRRRSSRIRPGKLSHGSISRRPTRFRRTLATCCNGRNSTPFCRRGKEGVRGRVERRGTRAQV
jgi:hypothetical protein